MPNAPFVTGHCLCGAVSYVIKGASVGTGQCHCKDCQRASGTPVGARPIAESMPLHRGRRTQVRETDLRHENGRLAAKITQTQIVIDLP